MLGHGRPVWTVRLLARAHALAGRSPADARRTDAWIGEQLHFHSLGVGEVCRRLRGIGPITCAPAAWSTGATPECTALRARVGQGGGEPAAPPAAPDEGRGAAAAAAADIARDAGGGAAAADDEALAGESCTLYVKNLAFATADAALAAHFDAAVSAAGGRIRSARVSRRASLSIASLTNSCDFLPARLGLTKVVVQ